MSRRLLVNLVVFVAGSIALVVYGYATLIGNPLQPPTEVSTVFSSASGLGPDFSVELNGVDVGSVASVALTRHGARVDMAIDHGVVVPNDVTASVAIANDLGEQVVELTPRHGGSVPPLAAGAVIPAAKDGLPANVGQVVESATKLLDAIPAGKLNALLADLATALNGRAADLRTIVSASTTFSQEFLAYQTQFRQLLADAPPVLNAVTAVSPQLRQALVNTETIVQVLATQRSDVDTLLKQGSSASDLLGGLVTSQASNIGCLLHDTSQTVANLSQPSNLSNLSESLADNSYFFGAVENAVQPGEAKSLAPGQANDPDALFLRTRLLLPPASPSADTYASPQGLPAIEPGAACDTEFGSGTPAATQAGFQPAAGGTVDAPTASEAQVRGGGDPPSTSLSAADTDYEVPGGAYPGSSDLLPLVGLVMPALFLAWRARPSRRRLRRRS